MKAQLSIGSDRPARRGLTFHRAFVSLGLSAAYWIFRGVQRTRHPDPLSGTRASALELLRERVNGESTQQRSELSKGWLRAQLRRWPYWRAGHLHLGWLALSSQDLATAYASAHAAKELAQQGTATEAADHLLARTQLAAGSAADAVPILKSLIARRPYDGALQEDLGAALMGVGDYTEAKRVITAIPEDERSAEARSALAWLTDNIERGSTPPP